MIDQRELLRHVTMWSRSPALELSMLIEGPPPEGHEVVSVSSELLGLEGFWSHPRRLNGEPDTKTIAGDDDYPVVATIPLAAGGVTGLNVLTIDPVVDHPGWSELLFYIPYDIVETCWDVHFLTSPLEDHARMFAEVAGWALRLRGAFPIVAAVVTFEGLFPGWATLDPATCSGLWMKAPVADALGMAGETTGDDRAIPWNRVAALITD